MDRFHDGQPLGRSSRDLRGAPRQRRNSEACSDRAPLRAVSSRPPQRRGPSECRQRPLHAPSARSTRGGEPRVPAHLRARALWERRGARLLPLAPACATAGVRAPGVGTPGSQYAVHALDAFWLVSSRPYYGACTNWYPNVVWVLVDVRTKVPSDGTDGVCSCSSCSFAAAFPVRSGQRAGDDEARRGAARWRCRGTASEDRTGTDRNGARRGDDGASCAARRGVARSGARRRGLARRGPWRGPLGTAGTPIPAPPAAMGRRERLAQMLEVENAKEKVGGRCAVPRAARRAS